MSSRHEPDEHHLEAVTVKLAVPVTTERMLVYRDWHERLDRLPDDVLHFGVERAHDGRDLHSVVGR